MAGVNFKDTWDVSSTFTGGYKNPLEVLIVGLDIPIEDWNRDLADSARLAQAHSWLVTPEGRAFVESIAEFGVQDAIKVVKRRDLVLAVDGRTRILGAREVNEDKIKAKDRNLVQIPCIPDKSKDQAITARIANEHRRDDPPFVKAHQAAHLRSLGKSDKQICLAFGLKQASTLADWFAYLNLPDDMRAQVEDTASHPHIPFAVAYEIGKLGPREFTAHRLALDTLINTGAVLRGEQGRANAVSVVKMIQAKTLTQAPAKNGCMAAEQAIEDGADEDTGDPPESGQAEEPVFTPGHVLAGSGGVAGPQRASRGPKTQTGGGVLVLAPNLTTRALRLLCATLEPTTATPHTTEAERAVYAMLAAITGKDPGGDGLAPWPVIQTRYRQVGRSGQAEPGTVGSCPAKGCDRGVRNGKTCSKCGGDGKSKPGK